MKYDVCVLYPLIYILWIFRTKKVLKFFFSYILFCITTKNMGRKADQKTILGQLL